MVPKWPAVKVGRTKKKSVYVRKPLLRRISFTHFQLWRLAILEPLGVQRHNVHHFKGLIVLYLDSRSSKVWQHFYLLPRSCEKGHFRGKTSYCPIWFAPCCNSYWVYFWDIDTQSSEKSLWFFETQFLLLKSSRLSWNAVENIYFCIGKVSKKALENGQKLQWK